MSEATSKSASFSFIETGCDRGAWVAHSVKRPTLTQVMITQFMSSSPTLGSVLTAQNLEPTLDSLSRSLFAPPWHVLCLSLSQK